MIRITTFPMVPHAIAASVAQLLQHESLGILARSFNEHGLFPNAAAASPAHRTLSAFSPARPSAPNAGKVKMASASPNGDIHKWISCLNSARPGLADLYKDHKGKINLVFYISTCSAWALSGRPEQICFMGLPI